MKSGKTTKSYRLRQENADKEKTAVDLRSTAVLQRSFPCFGGVLFRLDSLIG